jgi:asparagine synthetase B (glutamine-hydrolysing)
VLGALRTAVDRRLVADVDVGVLLSGGLDSSLIVGLLAEQGQTGLNTFSVGFESVGDEAGDEFQYSDIIAKHYGTGTTRSTSTPRRACCRTCPAASAPCPSRWSATT